MPNILKHQPESPTHRESADAKLIYHVRESVYGVLDAVHPSLAAKVNSLLVRLKLWELNILGEHASTLVYHEPDRLILATNNTCNFRCIWCPQSLDNFSSSFTMTDMKLDDIEAILSHQTRKLDRIDIQGIGEPLLHRNIVDVINLAGMHARNVEMVTNGSLLSEERIDQIKDSALTKMNVSIDGTDEETFQKIRGWSLEDIKKNVLLFREKTETPVEFWITISSENMQSLQGLPAFMEKFPSVSLHFQIVKEGFVGNDEWRMEQKDFTEFQIALSDALDSMSIRHNLRTLRFLPKQREGICVHPFVLRSSISTDGNQTPCCMWTNNDLSQVQEVGVARAWNSDAMRKFRALMLKGAYPKHCVESCNYHTKDDKQS